MLGSGRGRRSRNRRGRSGRRQSRWPIHETVSSSLGHTSYLLLLLLFLSCVEFALLWLTTRGRSLLGRRSCSESRWLWDLLVLVLVLMLVLGSGRGGGGPGMLVSCNDRLRWIVKGSWWDVHGGRLAPYGVILGKMHSSRPIAGVLPANHCSSEIPRRAGGGGTRSTFRVVIGCCCRKVGVRSSHGRPDARAAKKKMQERGATDGLALLVLYSTGNWQGMGWPTAFVGCEGAGRTMWPADVRSG